MKQLGFFIDLTKCTAAARARLLQGCARPRSRPQLPQGPRSPVGQLASGRATGAWHQDVRAYYISMACNHCADPACVKVCPTKAHYKRSEDGLVVIDPLKCIGCGMCSAACPWNMPHINAQTGTSTKCISCGRCAEQCPNGAIKFIDWEDIAQKAIDEGVVSTATIVEA